MDVVHPTAPLASTVISALITVARAVTERVTGILESVPLDVNRGFTATCVLILAT